MYDLSIKPITALMSKYWAVHAHRENIFLVCLAFASPKTTIASQSSAQPNT